MPVTHAPKQIALMPKVWIVIVLTALFSIIAGMITMDLYIRKAGREFVSAWYASELTTIQQGNLLAAVSKTQRMLLSTDFIEGVVLIDIKSNEKLIEIGNAFDTVAFQNSSANGEIETSRVGLISYVLSVGLNNRNNQKIFFYARPLNLAAVFSAFWIVFAFSMAAVATFTAVESARSERKNEELLIEAINNFSEAEIPTALLEKNLPNLIQAWTELRQRNRELIADRIKFELNHELVSLASSVAHDIRSPLSAINLATASISGASVSQKQLIINATIRINEIANGLLHQYRLHRPSIDSPRTFVSHDLKLTAVMQLIQELAPELRQQSQSKNIELTLDIQPGINDNAMIDASQLKRVIVNLVQNSIEAIQNDGEIKIGLRKMGKNLSIIIADNGKGIPEELLAKLGETPISEGKQGSSSGSGLGLFTAKKTVLQMGGSLQIQSKLELGTLITLNFPAAVPLVI